MSISSTLVDRAEIRFREAAGPLRPFVGCFWTVTTEHGATIRVVPDGSTSIAVEVRQARPLDWQLRGPLIRPDERRYASPTTMIGIRLRPGVAFVLSGIAAHRMVGCRVSLNRLPTFHDLVATDVCPPDPDRCIDVLETFLLRRLEKASLHPVVATALGEIERERGNLPIANLASRCGVSHRHLHRLMRVWVGYGPKRYANVVRFQATLHQMEHAPARRGAALALETGYFDQAHLTLDVTRFGGATPTRLARVALADFSKTRCDDLT